MKTLRLIILFWEFKFLCVYVYYTGSGDYFLFFFAVPFCIGNCFSRVCACVCVYYDLFYICSLTFGQQREPVAHLRFVLTRTERKP